MQNRNEKVESKVKQYFFNFNTIDEEYHVSYPAELETVKQNAQVWAEAKGVPMSEVKIIESHMPEKDFIAFKSGRATCLSKERAEMMLSKNEKYKEIKKNSQTLLSLHNDRNSLFSTLPTEILVKIGSLMGNDPNVIAEDNEACEIASKILKKS